jgi:hypothetical protein
MTARSTTRPWLRSLWKSLAGKTASTARRRPPNRLRCTRLEDRLTPANVLANVPEANQQTLTQFFTQSETASVAFGNTIVVAFNDSGSNAGGNRFTGYARSIDNGATFTDLGALTGANNDAGDPVLARDEVSGRIYFATLGFSTSAIQIFRSNDNGLTFGAPINAFGSLGGSSLDKEWIAVDNFAGAGQGNLYVIARDFGGSGSVVFTRSTDGGATFAPSQNIVSGNQGAFVVVNADHSINVFWLQGGSPQTIRTRRSTDGGVTFGATTTAATLLTTGVNGDLGLTRTTGGSGFRSNAFPSVAANPTQPGVLYLAYADNPAGTDKADIRFVQSNDFGATWSGPITVNTDGTTTDQFQPSVHITPNGLRLSISWYDRRLDAANSLIDYFARSAIISGTTTTFAADFRVTDTSFAPDFGRDNVVNSVYMGDYDQGSATNSRFIYVWADNRLGGPDVRVSTVAIAGGGPFVFTATPTGITNTPSPITITFDQAMDPNSFSFANDVVSFTRNGADVRNTLTNFAWSAGNTVLTINHTSNLPGAYQLVLGPQILNVAQVPMDNDLDGTPGEDPDDRYTLNFIVPFARITSATPSGATTAPVTSATFNFSQTMDTSSFSVAQDVFSFTGPAGNLIPFISGFQWVTNQQLRIDFASQSIPGNYSLVLNPTILSANGFALDNNQNGTAGEVPGDRFTDNYSIGGSGSGSNTFGYRWASTPFNAALNIQPGQPGVNSITFAASQDDDFTLVSLGTNTFNFYGTTFTSVNIGTNGIIGFNGGVSAFTNTDLTTSPTQSVFCPLWDDLHIGRNTATDDLVLTQFQDLNSDGIPDQLVINWRNVHWFNGSSTSDNGVTFEAVLKLNTGTVAGQMIANWVDLDDGSGVGGAGGQNFGASATVGIKTAGSTPATGDPLVPAFNGNNPAVPVQNQAIRIFTNSAPIANANGPYTVAPGGSVPLSSAGTSDPEGDPLTLIWDLDGDGTFGETGAGATRGDEVGASPTFIANGLVNGNSVQVTLRAFDSNGAFTDAMATVNVVGASAPVVTGVAIGDGVNSIQRSKVTQLAVSFDQVISYVGAQTAAYTVVRTVGGVPTGSPVSIAVNTTTVSGHSVATITFLDNLDPTQTGSLNDGHFRLTVNHLQITGMTADSVTNFHRFYGDVTGDEHVDIADFGIFSGTFNLHTGDPGFLAHLDKNNDGVIDIFDFGQFSIRLFTTLP